MTPGTRVDGSGMVGEWHGERKGNKFAVQFSGAYYRFHPQPSHLSLSRSTYRTAYLLSTGPFMQSMPLAPMNGYNLTSDTA